jgi:hypothetical protein
MFIVAGLVFVSVAAGLYVRYAPKADPLKVAMSDPWVRECLSQIKAAAPASPPAAPGSATKGDSPTGFTEHKPRGEG